jgi:hypothetical protein
VKGVADAVVEGLVASEKVVTLLLIGLGELMLLNEPQ